MATKMVVIGNGGRSRVAFVVCGRRQTRGPEPKAK
jgi:hypothetical protein